LAVLVIQAFRNEIGLVSGVFWYRLSRQTREAIAGGGLASLEAASPFLQAECKSLILRIEREGLVAVGTQDDADAASAARVGIAIMVGDHPPGHTDAHS
jgi:hypothetical protein